MQRVENEVGTRIQRTHQRRQITADIDQPHLVAAVHQRLGAFAPARQRNLALGRPPAHHHRYGLGHRPPSASAMRRGAPHPSPLPARGERGGIRAAGGCGAARDGSRSFQSGRSARFPTRAKSRGLMDTPPDLFAEALEIGRCGASGVDQKIGVLLRHHRAAAGRDRDSRQHRSGATRCRRAGF